MARVLGARGNAASWAELAYVALAKGAVLAKGGGT